MTLNRLVVTRCAAAARIAAGLAFVAAPRRTGGLLIASHAEAPGARLFIAAFGARDALLGTGTLASVTQGGAVRPWLVACAAADAFDAVATLRLWGQMPPGRRALTFAVSALPATVEAALAWRLGD